MKRGLVYMITGMLLLVLFGMVAAIAAALIVLWVKRRKR